MVEPVATDSNARLLEQVIAREKVIKTEWHDKTKSTFELYEGGREEETPFNILYSNTEILVPNLFSSAPKPVVRKRFGEMRADMASRASERMAEYCMDTNISGYPEFVEAIEAAVLSAALPGQGQCRARVIEGVAVVDYVQHDQFIWGYAKRWEDTPWVAYRHDKTLEDTKREFNVPEAVAAKIVQPEESSTTKDKGPATLAIYEVWNKLDRQVYFLCESFPDKLIQQVEDPLGIAGFFPSGKPLRLLSTPISTMPRSMYNLYKRQAEELNAVTARIKRVTQAIQVKGIYDGNLPELANLFDTQDMENSLTPATNPGGMARDGGLDRHIWMVPVDKLIVVLQQLFQIREQIKSTIYEILGIGDILRGVSAASETASAQQIKDKWGSLRIKKSREKVSSFVRWHIRTMIALAANHTPEDVWAKVTGLELMPTAQASLMPPPQPGQPVPETWGSVLALLKDDLQRSYIIDIESNSTVDGDATEEKTEVTDFMNALGQSMTAIEGLATQGPEGYEAGKALLIEICKRFRIGNELQSIIMKMKMQPKGPTEEQQQAQDAIEQKQKEVTSAEEQLKGQSEQLQQQFMQNKQQLDQLTQGLEAQSRALEKAKADLELAQSEFDLHVKEAQLEISTQERQVQQAASDLALQHGKAVLDVQGREQSLAGKQAIDAVSQAGQAQETAAEPAVADTAITQTLAALTEQGAVIKQLLETLTNPPKMVIKKTGPSTFERSVG